MNVLICALSAPPVLGDLSPKSTKRTANDVETIYS